MSPRPCTKKKYKMDEEKKNRKLEKKKLRRSLEILHNTREWSRLLERGDWTTRCWKHVCIGTDRFKFLENSKTTPPSHSIWKKSFRSSLLNKKNRKRFSFGFKFIVFIKLYAERIINKKTLYLLSRVRKKGRKTHLHWKRIIFIPYLFELVRLQTSFRLTISIVF